MRSSHSSQQQQQSNFYTSITLPQIKISDFDVLLKPAGKRVSDDWETGVKALGSLPGYKYSATFISSLRSNLVLSASNPTFSPTSSQFNTPISTPRTAAFSHSASLQQPSPLYISAPALQAMSETSHDGPSAASTPASSHMTADDKIPTLTYEVVKSDDRSARIAALKLVADSVAQQRQTAGRAIILNPVVVSTLVVLVALATRYLDWTILATTGMGVVMAGLLGVRLLTSPYIGLAEEINFGWLDGTNKEGEGSGGLSDPSKSNPDNGKEVVHKRSGSDGKNSDPIIIISRWGEEIMGTVILRFVKKERKGYVRAYTVRLRYRRKSVGEGLLEEAVGAIWSKGGRGLEFDDNHANSKMILPNFFNGVFQRNEKVTREQLARVVDAQRKKSNR